MDLIVISFAAIFAAGLTLFSGFGLGTLLMPVMALFLPIEVAVAITALVHCANNLFKALLLGRMANRSVLWRFGLPAVIAAFAGAFVLSHLAENPPLFQYSALGKTFSILPIKIAIGLVMLAFIGLELSPRFQKASIDRRYLPLGGLLSGFFGGLSGHQGALRTMFLVKTGLSKEEFIASGVVIAVMVDLARMAVYGVDFSSRDFEIPWTLVITASVAAFVGSYAGSKAITKITIKTVQSIVSLLLAVIAVGLIIGAL